MLMKIISCNNGFQSYELATKIMIILGILYICCQSQKVYSSIIQWNLLGESGKSYQKHLNIMS